MTPELWAPIASMFGVILGGALAFVTQQTTHRATERTEERKRLIAMSEARRKEQIEALTDFIKFAFIAEGVAHNRPESWHAGDEWHHTARPAMDQLWIAENRVKLLCDASLQTPITAYARALNQAVWKERDTVPIADRLEPFKSGFLTAARRSLDADEAS